MPGDTEADKSLKLDTTATGGVSLNPKMGFEAQVTKKALKNKEFKMA